MAAGWKSLDKNLRFMKLNCINKQSPKSFGALACVSFPSFVIFSMQTSKLREGIHSLHLKLSIRVYTCEKK